MYAYERLCAVIKADVWNEEDARMLLDEYPDLSEIDDERLPPLFHLGAVPFNEARTAFFYDRRPDAVFVNAAFESYRIYTPFHAAIKFDNVELVHFYVQRNPRVLDLCRNQNVAAYAGEVNAPLVCTYLAQRTPALFDEKVFVNYLPIYTALRHQQLRAFDAIFTWTKNRLHLPYYDSILEEEWHGIHNCDVRNDTKPRCAELAAALIETRLDCTKIGQLCANAFKKVIEIQFARNPDVLEKLLLALIVNGQQARGTSLRSMTKKIIAVLRLTKERYLRAHDTYGNTFLHHCFTKNYTSEMGKILSLVAEIDPGAFFVRNNQGELPFSMGFSTFIKRYETTILRAIEQCPRGIFETQWKRSKKIRPQFASALVRHARTREEFLFLYERCTLKARPVVLVECPMILEMRTEKGLLVKDRILTYKREDALFLIMAKTLQYFDLDVPTSYGFSIRALMERRRAPMIRHDDMKLALSSAKHRLVLPTSMMFFLFIAEEYAGGPRRH